MRVFVYFNLHKKKWSVKDWKTKKVITHLDEIYLINCTFKVSQAGRKRVLIEKRKNVHAGILGEWVPSFNITNEKGITYNPYKYSSFVEIDNQQAIYKADKVKLKNKKVFMEEL